jgi:hypothetical protein
MELEQPQQYTEDEIRQVAEMLNSGIMPVAEYELDEVLKLLDILRETIDKVYENRKLGQEDFLALQDLWNQGWLVHDKLDAIEHESQNLGLFAKISLVIRGFIALNKLLKSIKKARA